MPNRRPIWRATSGNAWIAIAVGLFFFAIGVVVTLVGTSILFKVAQSNAWTLTTATVYDRQLLMGSRGSTATLFKVEFSDDRGQKHKAEGTWDGNQLDRETVEILYNPADPSQTLFDRESKQYMGRVMTALGSFVLLTSGFLAGSGIHQILRRRRENREFEEAKAERHARKEARHAEDVDYRGSEERNR